MPSVIESQLARPQPSQNLDLSLIMSNERSPSAHKVLSASKLQSSGFGMTPLVNRLLNMRLSSGQREARPPARRDSQDPVRRNLMGEFASGAS